MSRFLADPLWHAPLLWWFVLSGTATGLYACGSLIRLFSPRPVDHRIARAGFGVAVVFLALGALALLGQASRAELARRFASQSAWSKLPESFWLFAGFSVVLLVSTAFPLPGLVRRGSTRSDKLDRAQPPRWPARLYRLSAAIFALLCGSQTQSPLATELSPSIWTDSTWVAPAFVASSATMGLGVLLFITTIARGPESTQTLARLRRALNWSHGLEGLTLLGLALSLGTASREAFGTWPGLLVPVVAAPLGLIAPRLLKRIENPWSVRLAALIVLVNGLAVRAALLGMPFPSLDSGA